MSRKCPSKQDRSSFRELKGVRLMKVNRAGALTIALITVFWAATPALACLLPEQQMTPTEQECCQRMAGQCGSEVMPSGHTCCQHPDRETSVSPVAKYSAPRHFTVAVLPRAVPMPISSASISGHSLELSTPQPEASPGCSSILRI